MKGEDLIVGDEYVIRVGPGRLVQRATYLGPAPGAPPKHEFGVHPSDDPARPRVLEASRRAICPWHEHAARVARLKACASAAPTKIKPEHP